MNARLMIAALLLMLPAVCAAAASDEKKTIGTITIETGELFDEGISHGGFFRAANALHVQTRPSLIRRLLLFHEGDSYDPEKLAETERNLRRLDFLSEVAITTTTQPDGTVDILVRTSDAWTTDPSLDFSHQSASRTYSASVTQKDLFGSGAEMSLTYGADLKRSTRAIEFSDPSFIVPYLDVEGAFASNSDGYVRRLAVSRPFYSYSVRTSIEALFDRSEQNDRLYSDGAISSIFTRSHEERLLRFSYALRANALEQERITFDVDQDSERFIPLSGRSGDFIPVSRQFRFFDVGLSSSSSRFAKLAYVDDEHVQDFHLGRRIDLSFGIDPQPGARLWRASIDASEGFELSPHAYLIPAFRWSSRFAPAMQNEIESGDIRFIWTRDSRHPSAFVSRLRIDRGHNLDGETQFYADGVTGLRAYPAFAFEGDHRVMLNVEERLFLGRELFQLFSPGAAAFLDAGEADTGPNAPGLRDLKKDLGLGLRLGISRFGSTTIRLDAAYALDPAPNGRHGLVFSFGTSQAF
jgi:hypothetical protein